jgi:hypothetical protein
MVLLRIWFGPLHPETAQRLRLHWRTRLDCEISRFLVALPLVRDLLLCAKHLFVAAMMVWVHPGPATNSANRPNPPSRGPPPAREKSWLRFRPPGRGCAGHFRPQNSVQVVPPGGDKTPSFPASCYRRKGPFGGGSLIFLFCRNRVGGREKRFLASGCAEAYV